MFFILAGLCFVLSVVATAQTRTQSLAPNRPLLIQEGDCVRPIWSSSCDVAMNCSADTPSSGCSGSGPGCTNCGLALLMLGAQSGAPDEATAFWGKMEARGLRLSVVGPLAKHGVEAGDLITAINGYRPTKRRLHNWMFKRKNPALVIKVEGRAPFVAQP